MHIIVYFNVFGMKKATQFNDLNSFHMCLFDKICQIQKVLTLGLTFANFRQFINLKLNKYIISQSCD